MNDKLELLDEVQDVLTPERTVDFEYFVYIFFLVTLFLVLAFPKIYFSSQIYYKSRDISKLQGEYETLKEENKLIRSSVEEIKFKNQILDTLF
jgi:cell division protein FtsL